MEDLWVFCCAVVRRRRPHSRRYLVNACCSRSHDRQPSQLQLHVRPHCSPNTLLAHDRVGKRRLRSPCFPYVIPFLSTGYVFHEAIFLHVNPSPELSSCVASNVVRNVSSSAANVGFANPRPFVLPNDGLPQSITVAEGDPLELKLTSAFISILRCLSARAGVVVHAVSVSIIPCVVYPWFSAWYQRMRLCARPCVCVGFTLPYCI